MTATAFSLAASSPLHIHYPLVVISDTHLGKKAAAADMLYEFLQRIRCDTLILNGDIIDGWVLMKKAHRKFPEMHKRVMDLLNARIAEGMNVVYIPGNHDEKLRHMKLFGKDFWGMHFADSLVYTDPKNRRFFILHGDQYDPNFLKDKGKILYHVGDAAYDGLIELNAITSKAARKLLKKRFSIAAFAKKKTKNLLGVIGKFEDVVCASAQDEGVDGVICGHIHHAEWDTKGNTLYGNSGDWVESCTALACDNAGEWRVIDWMEERERLGLSTHPDQNSPHPYGAYREVTERQLRHVQKIWPSRDRAELLDELREKRRQIIETTRHIQSLKRDLKL